MCPIVDSRFGVLFVVLIRYVKKRVADLIDREFIARDEDNPMVLHYLA